MERGPIAVGVAGCGHLGVHHLRILSELPGARVVGFAETNDDRAAEMAGRFSVPRFARISELAEAAEAVVIATPTTTHHELALACLSRGADVLVEKPFTSTLDQARELCGFAERQGRILQVGHVERFNPAVTAVLGEMHGARFVEVHRMAPFSSRSLDIDVILDLMIHDLQILLDLTQSDPCEVKAVGIPVLTAKVDIANVRLEFPGGTIANLTASRVSTEKVRKFRAFQPRAYFSIDCAAQEVQAYRLVDGDGQGNRIEKREIVVTHGEPLRLELEHFLGCVASRQRPLVSGGEGMRALALALDIVARIESNLAS